MLKAADRPAWLAALFAPAEKRPFLHALGAFAVEIAAVRSKVREPLAGELRLQWWTDAIEGEARGDVRGHPVAAALIDTIRRAHLPRAAFVDMLDARRMDLYDDPLDSLMDYAIRADRIEGARIALAAKALSGRDDPTIQEAARHAGRALGVVASLRALSSPATPMHLTVPLDVLREQNIGAAEILTRRNSPAIRAALATFIKYGRNEFATLRETEPRFGPEGVAFLTSRLVATELARASRSSSDLFTTSPTLPLWRQQWSLWRASRQMA